MAIEITTVGDDFAVLHDGPVARRFDGLEPGTLHDLDGVAVRTLPRPGGELLCRFATVNDVHFGEVECGVIEGLDIGPVLSVDDGETPYPDVMNGAAIAAMRDIEPAAVVVKGDLTAAGTEAEYQAFLAAYGPPFGDRLVHVRGNHDGYHGGEFGAFPTQRVDLPGATLAVIDTTRPRHTPGRVTAEQLDWLDDVAATADRPVLVFGHHHVWDPSSNQRPEDYFGINPDDSEELVDLFVRRPALRGYFAGHTHRNRVRRFASTGEVPWVEVACVKDFPGSWAEYRVYEAGVLQIHHRISSPEALAWSERCRGMFAGTYGPYAFGSLDDRCFVL